MSIGISDLAANIVVNDDVKGLEKHVKDTEIDIHAVHDVYECHEEFQECLLSLAIVCNATECVVWLKEHGVDLSRHLQIQQSIFNYWDGEHLEQWDKEDVIIKEIEAHKNDINEIGDEEEEDDEEDEDYVPCEEEDEEEYDMTCQDDDESEEEDEEDKDEEDKEDDDDEIPIDEVAYTPLQLATVLYGRNSPIANVLREDKASLLRKGFDALFFRCFRKSFAPGKKASKRARLAYDADNSACCTIDRRSTHR